MILNKLEHYGGYKKFTSEMLPPEISLQAIWNIFEFLSPLAILLHGSYVTGKRSSPQGVPDLDFIIISFKIPFWSLAYLYSQTHMRARQKTNHIFDPTFITPYVISNILAKKDSSLRKSLNKGFTKLPRGGELVGYNKPD